MQYVRLGSHGPAISRIGLVMMSYGDPAAESWYLDEERAEPLVRQAVEAGITFFDTADMYSGGVSEHITGRLLRRLFNQRDEYVLATKVFYPTGDGPNDSGLSRAHIMAAVDASLRRLGTDHIDLYQVHRWDNETPIDETMTALDDLGRSGKVRYVGASLMYAWQFAKAQHTARSAGQTPFVSMQTRYNLAYREEEREMIPLCVDEGVGVLPYSPLARGLLAATRDPGAATPGPGAPDRGMPDRGMPDRGVPDRGVPDRGVPDRGAPGRGAPDGGAPDATAPDRGAPDSGSSNPRSSMISWAALSS